MYVYMAVHMAVHVCVLHIFAAHAGLWGALSTSVVQVVFPLNNFDLRKKNGKRERVGKWGAFFPR